MRQIYKFQFILLVFFFILFPVYPSFSLENDQSRTKNDYFNAHNAVLNQLYYKLKKSEKLEDNLEQKVDKTKDKLNELNEEIISLNSQLGRIKRQSAITERKILDITGQILISENNIRKLLEQIEVKELELLDQRNSISDYMTLIYFHKNKFYYHNFSELNSLKIILEKDYFSDALKEETYLQILEEVGGNIFAQLENTRNVLQVKTNQVARERAKLVILERSLEDERRNLAIQREGKQNLLTQTEGQKDVFQEMLLQSLDEQEKVKEELKFLSQNIEYLSMKIEYAKQFITAEDYEEILKIKEDFSNQNVQNKKYTFTIWPVSPRSISAYFIDAKYKRVFGVEHNALDIPQIHGTPILAPDKGLVIKTVENGFGYSYVVLAHRNNLITLYGHVSAILVKEGEFVNVGQIIALSGGTIGSKGAGARTTGPHVHFEVHDNGKVVDPLDYLDLSILPIEYIPVAKLPQLGLEIEKE